MAEVRMFFLMAIAAAADTGTLDLVASDAAPCGGYYVAGTAPAYDQLGVPVDARLAVQIGDNGCAADEAVVVEVLTAETVVAQWDFSPEDIIASGGVLLMTPATTLSESTAYTLRITLDYGTITEVPFVTGYGTTQGIQSKPVWDNLQVYYNSCDSNVRVSWEATPAADADGLSVLELRQENVLWDRVLMTLPDNYFIQAFEGGFPEEVCFTLVQIDGLGQEQSGGELCVSPEEDPCSLSEGCGCGQSGSYGWVLPLFLAGGWRRRR